MTTADQQEKPTDLVAAAMLLLNSMGLSLNDLTKADVTTRAVPTFAEFVPRIAATANANSASNWINYWRVLVSDWGSRKITEPTTTELMQLAVTVQQQATTRKNSRGGYGAMANFVDAVKYLYRQAIADKHLLATENPAAALSKPTRRRSPRHALSNSQLTDINEGAATTGKDPELDTLVIRLHTETACRRNGALMLRSRDLNRDQMTVRLREKGNTVRDQPVSPTLMNALIHHDRQRNFPHDPEGRLLRYRNGDPLTSGYYDRLWQRLGRYKSWISTLGVTAHWLRYTTLTWVERNFGYAVAAAFAGHATSRRSGTTLTYVEGTVQEVATALAALTGEPHPLALESEPSPEKSP
ncbi:tyrosine-type recombinase/integrase [Amycolatopsis sp. NPDC051758]|uniref:tyrosine-type recombinase/integrase n=1 Tax=Amycolatopsis sp. NPDC051758 TaxID=3363935 RepID=UPI0037B20A95